MLIMNDKLGFFFYTVVIHSDEGIKILYWLSYIFIIIACTSILIISQRGHCQFHSTVAPKAVECNRMSYCLI